MPKKKKMEVIETDEDFERIMEQFEEERTIEIKYKGRLYRFRLRELTRENLKNVDLNIFAEGIGEEDIELMKKVAEGKKLTKKEKRELEDIGRKRTSSVFEMKHQMAINVANLLEPPSDLEKALQFWKSAPFPLVLAAQVKALRALEISNEDLEEIREKNPDIKLFI
jgi:hypothetical protein